MKTTHTPLTLLTLSLLTLSSAHAVTISFTPAQDNVIYENAGNLSNGVGQNLFSGVSGAGGNNRELRSLITFDLSAIPAGAIINSVSLNLTANTPNRTTETITTSLHRLTGDWGEGTSFPQGAPGGGQGAPATLNDATWTNQFTGGDLWNTPGGDFDPNASASLDVTENRLYSWDSAGLVDDVQGFVDGTLENYGWILLANPGERAKRFGSLQSTTTAIPQLVVDFTAVPEPSSSALIIAVLIPSLLTRRRK